MSDQKASVELKIAENKQKASGSLQKAIAQIQAEVDKLRAAIESKEAAISKMDGEIQTLFDERDALITLVNQANERIDNLESHYAERIEKLEDLVRALTLQ